MPVGKYSSFEDCVSKNQDKQNPEAYCAQIEKNITGKWPAEEGCDNMNKKESVAEVPIQTIQTGDKVKKGKKVGDVVSSSPEETVVIWQDGKFTKEEPGKLAKAEESCVLKYFRERGIRI